MNDYFFWKGVNSLDMGVIACGLPPYTIAGERAEHIEVPGRAGSLTRLEGDDVYNDITVDVECFVRSDAAIAGLDEWLKGSGALQLPNWPSGWYQARVINQISLERILAGRAHRRFTVSFRLQPFRQAMEDCEEVLTDSGQFLTNGGSIAAAPVITVLGSGDITLMVGMSIVELEGVEEGIILDCGSQEAYWGTESLNNCMSGDFPLLPAGAAAVSWEGEVSSVTIRWREQWR